MRIRRRPQSCSAPVPPLPRSDLCPPPPRESPPSGPEGATAAGNAAVLHHLQPTSGCPKKEEVEIGPSLVQVLRGKLDGVIVGSQKTWNICGVQSSSTADSSSGPKLELEIGNENGVEEDDKAAAGRKRRRKPAVLMEGSRCSRVNGRGWRCCQQTLVGYSLCEHHLGKGRMRSMSSVRCNGAARKKTGASSAPRRTQTSDDDDDYVVDDDEEYSSGSRSRKKKMGTVKARSISSLLHDTDQSAAVAAEDVPPTACCAGAHREEISAMV